MKKPLNLVALIFALFMFFGVAKANQLVFTRTLPGVQEVPPTASPGIGSALVNGQAYFKLNHYLLSQFETLTFVTNRNSLPPF